MNIGLELKACLKSNPSAVTSPMEVYKTYLKSIYLQQKMPHYGKWPNLPAEKYVNMAVIEKGKLSHGAVSNNSKALMYGEVNAVRRKRDITFSDIAKPNKDGVLPKFVLLEGAPGVGKTTFAWEACRKWAEGEILQEFHLVILIRLRDECVRISKCLGDLLQYPHDPKIHSEVIEDIIKTGGQGVLILFEGYDELPASLQEKSSLYTKLIQGGTEFNKGTVLVTSRPWASEPFFLPSRNSRQVEQHVEILGFTAENIVDYISSMLRDEPAMLEDMKQYLELCPHIHSMMYIPLNCAIVLEVYKNSKEENSLVPKTMTELYSSLIRSLLLRYMYDLPDYHGQVISLDLQHLPTCLGNHFDSLAELAYRGIFTKNQQIIFPEKELSSDFNSLGLMHSSMELYVDVGATKSYNFLHLTIQEYLAAYHISTFSANEQEKFFNSSMDVAGNAMVANFLAGLSPTSVDKVFTSSPSLNMESLELRYTHWLFESKQKPRSPIIFEYPVCHPFTLYMLGHIIYNSSFHWKVNIEDFGDAVDFFARGMLSSHSGNSEAKLELCIILHDDVYEDTALTRLNCAAVNIKRLEITISYYCVHDNDEDDIYDFLLPDPFNFDLFIESLSNSCLLVIKHLFLDSMYLSEEHMDQIRSYLECTSTITSLELKKCARTKEGEDNLVEGLRACKSLEKLVCGCFIADRILNVSNLKVLHATDCSDQQICNLFIAMCDNHTIEELVVESKHGKISEIARETINTLLTINKTMKALTLEILLFEDDICALAKVMCTNSTLQTL